MPTGAIAPPIRAKALRRRSKLETIPPKVRETIYERIAIGVPLIQAALSCGIPRRTFTRWLEFGREENAREPYRTFAAGVDRALADFAVNGIREVASAGAKDWRAKAYLLDHGVPEYVEQEQAKRGKGDGVTVNVGVLVQSPEWRDLSGQLLERLSAFPDALAAVLEVMPGAVIEGDAAELGP